MVMSSGSSNSHVKKSVANRLRRATHTHTPARSAGRKKTHLASPPHPSGKMGFFLDNPSGSEPAHTTRVRIEIGVVRRIFRSWGVSSYSARCSRVSAPISHFRPWGVSSYSARSKRARSARAREARRGVLLEVL
jgi:hypothetical protein